MANSFWESPLTGLKGIGEKTLQKFQKLGISTRGELLLHCPYRYEDRSRLTPLRNILAGQSVLVEGKVIECKQITQGKKRAMIRIADKSGILSLVFFHYVAPQLRHWQVGNILRCYGQVTWSNQGLGMTHPDYEIISPDNPAPLPAYFTPVYATVAGLSVASVRKAIFATLKEYEALQEERSLYSALQTIHQPSIDVNCEQLLAREHPAYEQLIKEELFAHHLILQQIRLQSRDENALPFPLSTVQEQTFLSTLPFTLTAAQQRVWGEIQQDLTRTQPMLRLVQGDVGCGKTIIAALSAYAVVTAGAQVAIMVPTEILAEQHYQTFEALFSPLGYRCQLLTGQLKAKPKRSLLEDMKLGLTSIVIGTHALFQDNIQFKQLGLVVIDEQHRFGVHQRLSLQKKGETGLSSLSAHQLIMTATPIPRTLAMSRYAHLDLSVIDSLPPNRQPITTIVLPQTRKDEIIARIKQIVAMDQQVYWVCTLIEESEKLTCQAAEDAASELQAVLAPLNVGLVHGKMASFEKEQVMQDFTAGKIHVLVATTVIEVGVNVPKATLMIIENPERLGLAQLHQLRGRVGRGADASYCVLLYQSPLSENAQARLGVIRETQDGFKIAEADLQLRGAGEVLGTKQTGAVSFKIADYVRDADLIVTLKEWAAPLLALSAETHQTIIQRWCKKPDYAQA